MLKRLIVEQFVIIDKLDLTFEDGLTIVTGETGAGKSIILGAMGMILGEPAKIKSIRQGHDQSIFKAVVAPPKNHGVWPYLTEKDLVTADQEEFEIYRVMTTEGTETITLNDKPIELEILKEVGEILMEIHGQTANHNLLGPENQMNLLDLSGNFEPEVFTNVSEALHNVHRYTRELEEEEKFLAQHRGMRLKKLRAVVRKFEEIEMKEGFVEESEAEYARLLMAKETSEAFQLILSRLISGNGIVGSLASAKRTIEAQENVDKAEMEALTNYLDVALKNARDAVDEMTTLTPKYEIDTGPLFHLKKVLDVLKTIATDNKIAYEDITEFYLDVYGKDQRVKNGPERLVELKDLLVKSKNDFLKHAEILSKKRVIAAEALGKAITKEFPPLKLAKAEFIVVVEEKPDLPWTEKGFNVVTFTARMNPGMPFSPIAETASGGELARMILALKVVLQEIQTTTTLVFDEVDTGIGGSAAAAVGDRIAALSENTQVMVITHSPQVASCGDQHLHISKRVEGEVTISSVNELAIDQRINEISRMLAGDKVSGESDAAAQRLLDEAASAKQKRQAA